MVRFVYNSNLTATERAKIKSALEEIEASTNVRFYNATGEDTYNSEYGFYYPNALLPGWFCSQPLTHSQVRDV